MGGAKSGGTIFKITSGGAVTTLYNFAGTDGSRPVAPLILATDGNYYGTTSAGGANGLGTVFRITPAGQLTTLYSFAGADGVAPSAPLTQGPDGNFYGTTVMGGTGTPNSNGTIFKITPAGVLTTLHKFDNVTDGRNPGAGLIPASDGSFYGVTPLGGLQVNGTVFKVTSTGALTTLYAFNGEQPAAALLQGTDGNLYGTTALGGPTKQGSVFRLTLAPATNQPTITSGGIVPVFSNVATIQPASWISISGSNLAIGTASWNGDFPQSLLGTSVTINGKSAALWFVSPGQVNLQAPDDTTTGNVSVVVTTPTGTAISTVTLAPFAPSLSLLDGKHTAAIILRADGSGSNGGGSYDVVGPTGSSLGYRTVAAKAGDTLLFYGVGFGPTNPAVPSGKAYSGSAPTTSTVQLLINGTTVMPFYSGLTSAGLYQFNVVLPAGLGTGDVSLLATVGGVRSPAGVVLSLQ